MEIPCLPKGGLTVRMIGFLCGLLCMPLAWAALNPWPHPPPQDDDPFCVRAADADNLRLAFVELVARPSTAARVEAGAAVGRIAVRSTSMGDTLRWTADFHFVLGPSDTTGHERVVVTRVMRNEDRSTGAVTWSTTESEEIVLAAPLVSPTPNVADTVDALRAINAALGDPKVRAVAAGLLPYYHMRDMTTPAGATFASGAAVPVTLLFVNRVNPRDRMAIVIDVTAGMAGQPEVKGLRSPAKGGGR